MDHLKVYEDFREAISKLSQLPLEQVTSHVATRLFEDHAAPFLEHHVLIEKTHYGYKPLRMPEVLTREEALLQIVKVIGLMESSDNMIEFMKLNKKRKEKNIKEPEQQEELTDWDKFMGAALKVPKPTKEDLKKHNENNKKK